MGSLRSEELRRLSLEFMKADAQSGRDIATLKLVPERRDWPENYDELAEVLSERRYEDVNLLCYLRSLDDLPECQVIFRASESEEEKLRELFVSLATEAGAFLPDDGGYDSAGTVGLRRWCKALLRRFGWMERYDSYWLQGNAFQRSQELAEELAGQHLEPANVHRPEPTESEKLRDEVLAVAGNFSGNAGKQPLFIEFLADHIGETFKVGPLVRHVWGLDGAEPATIATTTSRAKNRLTGCLPGREIILRYSRRDDTITFGIS